MNIAIFTDCYTPQINGVVTVIRTIKNELEKRGHNTYIFTVQHPNAAEEKGVYRIKSYQFSKDPQHRIGVIIERQIINIAKSLKIDLIHTHTEFSLYVLSRKVSHRLKIPSIHTLHTYYPDYLSYTPFLLELILKKNLGSFIKRHLKNQSCIIVPSRKNCDYLQKIKNSVPVKIIPNGIDLSLFYKRSENDSLLIQEFRRRYNISEFDKLIVFVGRLGFEKNIYTLLDNFKEILLHRINVKLLLVGDGPDRQALQEHCYNLELGNNVIFTGYLRWPDEIKVVYAASHLFMSASHSEVHPVTFIEAMASGLPIVVVSDSSNVDMVLNGENGWALEEDKLLWTKALEILNDEQSKARMGQRSLEISEKYSVSSFIDSTLAVYNEFKKPGG